MIAKLLIDRGEVIDKTTRTNNGRTYFTLHVLIGRQVERIQCSEEQYNSAEKGLVLEGFSVWQRIFFDKSFVAYNLDQNEKVA